MLVTLADEISAQVAGEYSRQSDQNSLSP